jgi:uncharacterized repeat protein (TIGR03803 family)
MDFRLEWPEEIIFATRRPANVLASFASRSTGAISMMKRSGWKSACAIPLFCVATAMVSPAQVILTTLVNFDGSNGAEPGYGSLIQATDGNFYGTTAGGGAQSAGTVFTITTEGALSTLYSFCSQIDSPGYCTDGEAPSASLVQGVDGNFYGTTTYGGAKGVGYNSNGTIFKLSSSGKLTTLYSFCAQLNCADGRYPYAGLIQAANGDFYGTTSQGGASSACNSGNNVGCGTIFKITPTGTLTTLHSFDSTDGAYPYGGLIQATNGQYYGTTSYGTVYKLGPNGNLKTLHTFPDTEGPFAGLLQATDGSLYGTTYTGGNGFGSVFKITESGVLTTLYSFCEPWPTCSDGSWPSAGVVQASDGNFYGTTTSGGGNYCGTVFMIDSHGDLTTLHSFNETDGKAPLGGLLQVTNGSFYGTTSGYGADYDGTLFSLNNGLGPSVKTLPTAGRINDQIENLGTQLTGATEVTFDGTPARFTVRSPSLILTHVPSGAMTGYVKVQLSGATLSTSGMFYVLQ